MDSFCRQLNSALSFQECSTAGALAPFYNYSTNLLLLKHPFFSHWCEMVTFITSCLYRLVVNSENPRIRWLLFSLSSFSTRLWVNGCNGLQYEVNGAQVTAVIITLAKRSILLFFVPYLTTKFVSLEINLRKLWPLLCEYFQPLTSLETVWKLSQDKWSSPNYLLHQRMACSTLPTTLKKLPNIPASILRC